MSKVLSVCVPSYNMEKYLNRCIDSFLVPEVLDRLELIIVNDGSTDETLSIANDYKARYPQTIVVIDKPNGHYGSCVNASLKIATGKFFRIVDADDWVDSDALVAFINKLETIDVDCVCTDYTIQNDSDNTIEVEEHNLPCDIVLDLREFVLPKSCLRMHKLTYSLAFLKQIDYVQTEGICYTDTEYVYLPLRCAQTICGLRCSVYQYYVGREGQSVAGVSMRKNIFHILSLTEKILGHSTDEFEANANSILIRDMYLSLFGQYLCEIYLLWLPYKQELEDRIDSVLQSIKKIAPDIYKTIQEKNVYGIKYVKLWTKNRYVAFCILPFMRVYFNIKERILNHTQA